MSAISPFEAYHCRYEALFVRHKAAYWAELLAVRALIGLYQVVQEF